MFDTVLSQILYGMSGFFFAIFACRYGRLAAKKIKTSWVQKGLSLSFFLSMLPAILFLLISFFFFPFLLYTKTPVGGFVYFATYIFFNMKTNKNS